MTYFRLPNRSASHGQFVTAIGREGDRRDPRTLRDILLFNVAVVAVTIFQPSQGLAVLLVFSGLFATGYGIWRGAQYIRWYRFCARASIPVALLGMSGAQIDVSFLPYSLGIILGLLVITAQSTFIAAALARASREARELAP